MIKIKSFENGFKYLDISNKSATAKIALQGAHIFHFQKREDKPLLWLSPESDFKLGKAIRGGIPVCWPAFGMENPDLPQHGFARTSLWELVETQERESDKTRVVLKLSHSQSSLAVWNYRFEVTLTITIANDLTLALSTTNLDTKPFRLTEALHSYFAVESISTCKIKGLESKPYLDTLQDQKMLQDGDITFDGEFDVVYQEVDKTIELCTPTRSIYIENEGSSSVVVWNPWIEKSKRMSAMPDDGYKHFVCIESANARDDFRPVLPQKTHTLTTKISY